MAKLDIQKKEQTEVHPERLDQAVYYLPRVDILEDDEAFHFHGDLPGVSPEDLHITYENGVLTLTGRVRPRETEGRTYIWQEYGVGHFHRSFTLQTPVNAEGIQARLKNGEFHLRVPKAESAKTRRISIQAG